MEVRADRRTTKVRVTFASTDTIYEFVATVGEDGEIDARVDQPIVNVVEVPGPGRHPRPPAGSATPASRPRRHLADDTHDAAAYDDDHDEDHDEDHDDEDEEDERRRRHDEDDQEDEYEGGEDDD